MTVKSLIHRLRSIIPDFVEEDGVENEGEWTKTAHKARKAGSLKAAEAG